MKTNLNYSLAEVSKLAENFNVIPVIQTLFSGTETPISIFEKLAANRPGSFLLESAEQGVWARYSFVGVRNRGFLNEDQGGSLTWTSPQGYPALPDGQHLPADSLDAIAQINGSWKAAHDPTAPSLTSGLVGLMGWDVIRKIEKLGPAKNADFISPTIAFAMLQDLVIIDHLESAVMFVSNIYTPDVESIELGYEQAIGRIAEMLSDAKKPHTTLLADIDTTVSPDSSQRTSKQEFFEAIEKAKHYVRIGDVFQVVISQRFDIATETAPLEAYRVLRALNPSPYMYYLNFEDASGPYAVVGSSPESLVAVANRHAVTHPIAGSRPRGQSLENDVELAQSLLADQKERAEHLMLVDLARNDLLKVCEPETVVVTEFMQIHRYSHVMHLVSTVEGDLAEGMTAIDAFRATFPAGTLSGAPKPRALQIIDELEPAARGLYGGVVGYFDFHGNADLAIAIRTAFIRNSVAHIQAGAGLVLDSVPESEYLETVNKASAPARAITAANNMVAR